VKRERKLPLKNQKGGKEMKKVEKIKNTIYVYIDKLSEEEYRKIMVYLSELEIEEEIKIIEIDNMLIVKVSKYSKFETNEIFVDILKLLS